MYEGPDILANTINVPTTRASKAAWQYHPRSDRHSKAMCWTVLFDLLLECEHFQQRAKAGAVGFRVNHKIIGPIPKTLDLVVTVPGRRRNVKRRTFADLVHEYQIVLNARQRRLLNSLPTIEEDGRKEFREVAIALEAKACMTKHSGALPRLHAEILATGYLAKLGAQHCISVSYTMVNHASTFVAPSSGKPTKHTQPRDTNSVLAMIGSALPWATTLPQFGFDAIGASVVDCANDGTTVSLVTGLPAPQPGSAIHYEKMITDVCAAYRARRF